MTDFMKDTHVLGKNIVFQFVEEVNSKGEFAQRTRQSGIILAEEAKSQMDAPRWAKVLKTGNDVEHVNVGQYILIKPLQWTTRVVYRENNLWMTTDEQIVLVTDTKPDVD